MKMLLITDDAPRLSTLASTLSKHEGAELVEADSGEKALAMIQKPGIDLVITDETLTDMTGIEFVEKMITVNPMINSAVISKLTSEEFHEATEGLGVLTQLPLEPGEKDAEDLLGLLRKLSILSG